MISQFFILSPRGDFIINKDFRGDSIPNCNMHEIFFRKVKLLESNGEESPPVINCEDISFIFITINKLLLVCTTRHNVSASSTVELLNRLAKVFKDYLGVLTEESIRKNFTLIYELLDEMMDYGYPQITSSEALKSFIHNEPVVVTNNVIISTVLMGLNNRSKSALAPNISVINTRGGKQKNEVYVDIIERLSVLFSSSGSVINSSLEGSIQMRSFLTGNPELRLALTEDLIIGKSGSYGSVILDDCNFHECVNLDEFEQGRILHFVPPDGEFVLFNYRITGVDFNMPFRLSSFIEEMGPNKLEFHCLVKADIPSTSYGQNIQIQIPLSRNTISVKCDAPGCGAEYIESEKKVVWTIKKLLGGSDVRMHIKVTLEQNVVSLAQSKREIGPLEVNFEIPMYSVSNMQVRYLRIMEASKQYNPFRWVRYITQSSSYVCRV